MHRCPECGKEYGSKSGLRRHRKRDHPPAELQPLPVHIQPEPEEREPEPDAPEKPCLLSGQPKADVKALFAALKALGVEDHDIMAWKVYPDRVVIIEGPVGYKRIWPREE